MKNTPYVKKYENGILMNPIIDRYNSGKSLRKIKRNKERFLVFETLLNELGRPLTYRQMKTKRGKWNTINIK